MSSKTRIKHLPHQKLFYKSRAREVYLIGGVGCGKTTALVREAISLALANPGMVGMLTEPTYQMIEDILVPALLQHIEEKELSYAYKQSALRFALKERESQIILRSRERPLRLMGKNLAWAGSDEITLDNNDRAHLALLSRVREAKAKRVKIFGVGTPSGLNWFWERYIREGPPEGVEIIKATTKDNRFLHKDYYKNLLQRYDKTQIAALLEGEFVELRTGRVFPAFDREVHLDDLMFAQNEDLHWSHDFNVDPLCSIVAQISKTPEGEPLFKVIDEIVIKGGALTKAAAQEFIKRYGEASRPHQGKVFLYGDASGSRRSTRGCQSDYAIIKETLKTCWSETRIINRFNKSNPPLRDSINAVNYLLEPPLGEPRLLLDRIKTLELQKSLLNTVYEEGNGAILKDGGEHLADALRYLIHREAPLAKAIAHIKK